MLEPNKERCKTCPFRDTGWTHLRGFLEHRAMTEATPICHSTGPEALVDNPISEQELACRGARDFQIMLFHRMGVIAQPTDECWRATYEGMVNDKVRKNEQKRKRRRTI